MVSLLLSTSKQATMDTCGDSLKKKEHEAWLKIQNQFYYCTPASKLIQNKFIGNIGRTHDSWVNLQKQLYDLIEY